ncbi:Pimeloyl-ACP methyl ester carboxylesterase [Microbacterium sp. ru370.1]|uniref:alpha/beta fold hydrolase n=1 Tax=unclassified Microbacterium TaxID=2609290 RepID=UPI00088BA912|nr:MULTISPECIES: alpha/beta hydrolase [unclassified Microbacterium]SDO39007.1 Pimeloyl-ACP methyl ester carboxylesterase [Microbacterium sp. ru370.1]SIT79197.1 Pimeloyl-ACP methyl ester carboxylesterase [Microbacterium sp. RU1D]
MIALETGTGRPLIALHGFGVDHRIMLPLEQMTSGMPWRRIYIDLPWTHLAAATTTVSSAREVAAGVLAEIDAHLQGESFAVIGNSFGGMLARFVAHERRERVVGVATLAGVVEADHVSRTVPPRTVLVSDPAALERAGADRDAFTEQSVLQNVASLDSFRRFVLPGLRGADDAVMERIAKDYALDDLPERTHPEPFAAPALHLFGRQDHVVGYEDGLSLRAHYPRGSFVVVDGAGHNVHLERPELTRAAVRDWLDRMDAETAAPPAP